MARPLRIEFEGAWYHVMNRGAAHQDIFQTKAHRNAFLNLLREASLYYNIQCHAFCLMDNHYHLLIHTPQANLSQAMRHINGIYTQLFNRTEQKDGALFRGRYKAILIDKDGYLLQVSRYIHLNPVEANMVQNPEDYEWSSYHNYIHKIPKYPWLHTEMILNMISHQDHRLFYDQFVKSGIDDATKQFYALKRQPSIFGHSNFKDHWLEKLTKNQLKETMPDFNRTRNSPTLTQINEVCSAYFKVNQASILYGQLGKNNLPRRVAIYLSRALTQCKLDEIVKHYHCNTKSAVSVAIYKIKCALKKDPILAKQILQLKMRLLGSSPYF